MREEIKRINFKRLGQVLGVFSFLFLAFYFIFYLSFNLIHNFYPPVDQNSIVIWQQQYLTSKEGIELPTMAIGTLFYLLITYLIVVKKIIKRLKITKNLLVQLLPIGAVIFIIANTRSYVFTISDNIWIDILSFGLATALLIVSLWFLKSAHKRLKTIAFWMLWIIFGSFVIFSLSLPSITDYNFFIGPALKISQGEKLGSFYMQYGLGLTYLFKIMMDLHMKVSQMQILLGFSLVLWFGLYFILAARFIKNKTLLFLFMASLVVLRYFAVDNDPTFIPAVSPLRLDLWVLLALCILRFGMLSFITCGFVTLLYIADDTFGLFYLCIYFVFFCALSIKNFNLKKLLLIVLPVAGLIWHFVTFGSLVSMGAKLYQSAHLGFIPISYSSPFWTILVALPYFLWILLKEDKVRFRTIYLFLLLVGFSQLIYFFGRSNDNNLIHISGIFILLLLICLNIIVEKYKLTKTSVLSASILFVLSYTLFVGDIESKFTRALTSIVSFRLGNIAPVETYVNQHPNLLDNYKRNKLMLVTDLDSYYNYRYGLKQIGYYTPFAIHLYVNETDTYLMDKINNGYQLVFWEEQSAELIEQLNESKKMRSLGLQFETKNNGNLMELGLIKSAIVLTKTYQIGNLVTFSFPQTWRIKKISKQKGIIQSLSGQLNISFEMSKNTDKDISYLKYIDLSGKIPIKISGADKILSSMSKHDGFNTLHIIVIKGDRQLKLEMWPVEYEEQLNRFLSKIKSIEFK